MSNVMSLKNLRNHVSRNAFDLSERRCFTAKVGELLPVFTKEVLPGDKFNFKVQSFTRTQPVNTAAYTRIKEYYDYFFVPYRLLWRYFDSFVTNMQDNVQFATSITDQSSIVSSHHPCITPQEFYNYFASLKAASEVGNSSTKNDFGYYRIDLMGKLIKYLGLGLFDFKPSVQGVNVSTQTPKQDFTNAVYNYTGEANINIFPFLAYQKICQDYFRNSQWEKPNPSLWNVDYLTSSNIYLPVTKTINGTGALTRTFSRCLFDLNYCNWNKDLFMGLLPSPQYGDNVSVGAVASSSVDFLNFQTENSFDSNVVEGTYEMDTVGKTIDIRSARALFESGTFQLDGSDLATFSVLALRQAEALQKWKEISLSGQQDYKDQIEKHFGVHVSETRSNLCKWIGGSSDNIDITEVVNTNLASLNDSNGSSADIAGKGIGAVGGSESFEASEHGLIMCIYHAIPLLDYKDSVTNPLWFKSTPFDYAIPEFDQIGMQSLPSVCLSSAFAKFKNTSSLNYDGRTDSSFYSLGYVPRYAEYKTALDTVTGAFGDSLSYWTSAIGDDYFSAYLKSNNTNKLTSSFFKVNPAILDSIFAVNSNGSWATDNLLINSFHDVKVVRNLDYNGLPY